MQSVDAWDKIAEILIQEDFYNRSHRVIFAAITRLIAKNSAADPITLQDELEMHNELEGVGGLNYIVMLARNTPSSSNISAYANIVRERAVVRELIGAANDIADISFNPEGRDSKELLDLAETKVFEIAEKRTTANEGPISVSGALRKTISRIEELAGQDKEVTGVSTGFTDLDKKTSGLQPSDLIIVAARPSMGKCIVSGSTLVEPGSGKLLTIDQMVKDKRARVTSLNNDFKLETREVSDFVDDGFKPVFKVKTALGKEIETTITHPFLSGDGWQPLGKLQAGDLIGVPRTLPIFGKQTLTKQALASLAYSVSIEAKPIEESKLYNDYGVGSDTQADTKSPTFALSPICDIYQHVNASVAHELANLFNRESEYEIANEEQVSRAFSISLKSKVLPDSVFSLCESNLALLLNRLFACNGHLFTLADSKKSKDVRLTFISQSAKLVQQVQHLLLRLGVVAKRQVVERAKAQQHCLSVVSPSHLARFLEKVGIFGKTFQVSEAKSILLDSNLDDSEPLPQSVYQYAMSVCEQNQTLPELNNGALTRASAKAIGDLLNDAYLKNIAQSDVYWDEIVSIEGMGVKQVYDLSVPQVHNFIAQDICVHNTTFAMNLVENALLLEEKPVLVFSLEMPAEQIMMRMLASLSRVNQTSVRTARLEDADWARIQSSVKMLNDKDNLFIDDSSGLTPMEVRTRARKLARDRGGISMIMIDYLQLMRVPSLSDNRTLEISEISRSLKALAKELQCPVIALSQLNRGLEQRADKRPINSDLRESGAIEQDADLIMFIYRDEVYHENSELQGIAEIIIGKQRNGPIGTTRLTFQGQFSRFDNYAGPAYDDE
ncbi:replicative DNA helicase [Glaciecola sp. 2405UD65-10]|uniref:replicative DNA helicase n=1 Tax=Glaciecola sp. 2405UD65-10 TaxID=3397244 RepID=UPI003B5BF3F0